jgi:hypothetical protein
MFLFQSFDYWERMVQAGQGKGQRTTREIVIEGRRRLGLSLELFPI